MVVEVAVAMVDMVAGVAATMEVMVATGVGADTMEVLREVEEDHQEVQVSLITVLSGRSTTAAWEW